jgi:LmbE family N-acetylglucosaminyl deacetylase
MVPGTLRNVVVFSPHCDDAVFACGQLLETHPGALVVTMFAGRPPAVFAPLGLFHSDHRLVHEACIATAGGHRHGAWFLYEDALYRRIPQLVEERLTALAKRRLSLHSVSFPCAVPP